MVLMEGIVTGQSTYVVMSFAVNGAHPPKRGGSGGGGLGGGGLGGGGEGGGGDGGGGLGGGGLAAIMFTVVTPPHVRELEHFWRI
jgi:hypothetical protein